ncbi:MAG: flavin reductase family protein [Eubacteriaceae bacterium]|nr:flavin reductase family protein [Eubacteriaceae bacterium]
MKTKEIGLNEITKIIDPITSMPKNDWCLVTANDGERVNGLTAGWGAFGHVCNKPTATLYIRPQRFTKSLLDRSDYFTMTFFDFDKYKDALMYMGTHTGAKEPEKGKNAGLTPCFIDGDKPTYEEGRFVIVCRKFFCQQMAEESFTDRSIVERSFPGKDFSYIYMGEIIAAYEVIR